MVNKVFLIGNLGRDPEVRYTSSGKPVCNFSLATSERFKGRDGEMKERTEWHNIVVWGPSAEACGQYLAKGKRAFVEGRIQTREWDDRDGNKRRTTEVVANDVKFLSGPDQGGHQGNAGQQAAGQDYLVDDDDIPF